MRASTTWRRCRPGRCTARRRRGCGRRRPSIVAELDRSTGGSATSSSRALQDALPATAPVGAAAVAQRQEVAATLDGPLDGRARDLVDRHDARGQLAEVDGAPRGAAPTGWRAVGCPSGGPANPRAGPLVDQPPRAAGNRRRGVDDGRGDGGQWRAVAVLIVGGLARRHSRVSSASPSYTYGARGGSPVIVSSGDGGWIHLGPHVAEMLAAQGFFVVGFDVKGYLDSFTSGHRTAAPRGRAGRLPGAARLRGRWRQRRSRF